MTDFTPELYPTFSCGFNISQNNKHRRQEVLQSAIGSVDESHKAKYQANDWIQGYICLIHGYICVGMTPAITDTTSLSPSRSSLFLCVSWAGVVSAFHTCI